MPIQQFFDLHPRREIAFAEEEPPRDTPPQLSAYDLTRIDATDLTNPARLATLAAVIFRQHPQRPSRIAEQLKRFAPILLAHDCRVIAEPVEVTPGRKTPRLRSIIVRAIAGAQLPASGLGVADASDLGNGYPSVDTPLLTPTVHVLKQNGDWAAVAAHLQAYPPGEPPYFGLESYAFDEKGAKITLHDEHSVLLRRAFSNCAEVKLIELIDGQSEVKTFRAYASLRVNVSARAVPYQYFVKLGDRRTIEKEYLAYRDSALEHVPFHLGPRLRLERCALGASQGIIVCDYVSGAEKLRDCARDGRAVPVIANLYNVTLRAWLDGATPVDRALQDFIADRLPIAIPSHREHLIRGFGASTSPGDLLAILRSRQSKPVRVGVIHGDLHATNVLVRGGDAIVIDFEKVELSAPLLRDFASLESGLFVDGFIGDGRTPEDLLASVECLYSESALRHGQFDPCHPSDGSAWFIDCVRQIRMQARQIEPSSEQYALCLAVELAKKACKEKEFRNDVKGASGLSREDVRALAYVLAERILNGPCVRPQERSDG